MSIFGRPVEAVLTVRVSGSVKDRAEIIEQIAELVVPFVRDSETGNLRRGVSVSASLHEERPITNA